MSLKREKIIQPTRPVASPGQMALQMPAELERTAPAIQDRLRHYPRLRFMGSKYRLAPRLAEVFDDLPDGPAVDAFSGSGVVSYVLKAGGRPVTSNDQLVFATKLAEALVVNGSETLSPDDVDELCSGNCDGRDFIATTFDGLYFPKSDHEFLDAAWSHLDRLPPAKQALAIGSLCLAAAWKQPRGVFTITTPRYDDGRRQMRMPIEELFREAVEAFNAAVFAVDSASEARTGDVFDLPQTGYSVAYFDPPYAPPQDDTCYVKRYHFLEGLATYWRGQEIMWETKTRKIAKKYTPFAYKRSAPEALERLFGHFDAEALVVSYGSNAAVSADTLESMLRNERGSVTCLKIPHRYAFGTHSAATRREANEYIYIAT